MALRLIEIFLSEDREPTSPWTQEHPLVGEWTIRLEDEGHLIRALVDTEHSESFVDAVENEFGGSDGFRIVMLPVEATLPRENEENKSASEEERDKEEGTPRISREELYTDVSESLKTSSVYYTLVLLSTIVAAGGMMRNDVAVVVGAMVIAPLIGPNIALALGTTLGDTSLLLKSLRVNLTGLALALVLSAIIGATIEFSPGVSQIATRASVDLGSVALALAAGVAGALSMTRGISTALIGVMVAVALLPPLVALGMLLGAGYMLPAYGAGLLLLINVTSINLAAVVTFVAQGVRPATWYEAEEAKKKTRLAMLLWAAILAVLVAAVVLSPSEFMPKD